MTVNDGISDPRANAVLARLHKSDRAQFGTIVRHYLPRVFLTKITRRAALDPSAPKEAAFLRDKLIALDPDKGMLAYTFCRALDARCVVEVGTSFGVSTIYLAAALRDNGSPEGEKRRVIASEIEPTKAAAARVNWSDAGLDEYIELLEGDALKTLADIAGPIDFVLIDTWIPLALPALKLLAPRLRHGAVVMCDNVEQFAKAYRPYTDYVRNSANGFHSMTWRGRGGVEISTRNLSTYK